MANGKNEESDWEWVASMIEQLSQWWAGFSSSGLFTIDSIKSRVNENTKSGEEETVPGDIFFECVVIDEHVGVGQYNEEPADESNEIGSNPCRYEIDTPLPEWVHFVVEPCIFSWFVLVFT